jgi:hypothetical protein
MKRRLLVALAAVLAALVSQGQSLSDSEIESAIARGKSTTEPKLLKEIWKTRRVRLNRAGIGDPIEKRVTILSDSEKIALESTIANRELRGLTLDQVKSGLDLGTVAILLEANCYNRLYAGGLSNWAPGAAHIVLKVNGKVVQPEEKVAGKHSSTAVGATETGIISRSGNVVSYTPLYTSAIYERESQSSWFSFRLPSELPQEITVTVIGRDGKTKEKALDARLFR